MKRFAYILLLAIWLLGARISMASDCSEQPRLGGREAWVSSLYFENDLFAETDQNYTNGVRFSSISPDLESFERDPLLAGWVRSLSRLMARLIPGDDSDCRYGRRVVLSLGQSIYTPEDISATEVIVDQRPYAGWLYGGIAYNLRRGEQLDTLGLNLGVVGPAAQGKEAQDWVHELRGFDKFAGWHNQLRNELGIQLLWEQKRKFLYQALGGDWGSDLILHGGGSLGNVATYLNGGAEWRLGWRLPDDFGTSALRAGADNGAPGSDWERDEGRMLRRSLHLFASLDGRWVLRDIFLDGNSLRNSHSVDKEPLVADLATGITLLLGDVKIAFARVHRSREFKAQPHSHSYGSFSVSWTRLF